MSSGIAGNPEFCRLLSAGLEQLGYGADADSVEDSAEREHTLLRYLDMLTRWNKTYNLTAVTDPETMIYRHLLDSLAIARYLKGQNFIDIGTGAGLPGIPLAIWQRDKNFSLLDSNGKKTRFLVQAKLELALPNVEIIHNRVENHQPEARFDGVLSRAFASLAKMVQQCDHLLSDRGIFYAMKGKRDEQELSALPKAYTLQAARVLDVPGGAEQRHLMELIRTS